MKLNSLFFVAVTGASLVLSMSAMADMGPQNGPQNLADTLNSLQVEAIHMARYAGEISHNTDVAAAASAVDSEAAHMRDEAAHGSNDDALRPEFFELKKSTYRLSVLVQQSGDQHMQQDYLLLSQSFNRVENELRPPAVMVYGFVHVAGLTERYYSLNPAPVPGYAATNLNFYVYKDSVPGTIPLYQCVRQYGSIVSHIVTTNASCEGIPYFNVGTKETLGYIYPSTDNEPTHDAQPIYRCNFADNVDTKPVPNNTFVTTADPNACTGGAFTMVIGYGPNQ